MTLVKLDVDSRYNVTRSLGPVSIAANGNTDSSTIDLASYSGNKVLLVAAVGTRTDGTYTFVIRESDDDSTYTDATIFSGSLAAVSAANTTKTAAFAPTKRYLKIRVTAASVTTGALVAAFVLLPPATS